MATEPTNFSGLASGADTTSAYAHSQSSDEATRFGGYEKNTEGIRKLTLILYPYPRKQPKSIWSR